MPATHPVPPRRRGRWRLLPWRLAGRRRGVAATEFALAAPVLILLIMAAIDFGRAIDESIRLENAARAGAQYGLVFPDDTAGITARVRAALPGWSNVTPTASLACDCGGGGGTCTTACAQVLTVTVTRPFVAAFFVRIATLRGEMVVRIS